MNPFEKFLNFLPSDRKPLDPETSGIIQRFYGGWLLGVSTEESAIDLLETAGRHIHASTTYRIQTEAGLILDGIFEQSDSNSAYLMRAFEENTHIPKIIKFGKDVHLEHEIFLALNMTSEQAISNHLVPLSFIRDIGGKQGIIMPNYACSLNHIKSQKRTKLDAELPFLRGLRQIRTALSILHSHTIFHNDIKPGNILLDFQGNYHLVDYGSCTFPGVRTEVKYSDFYRPSDFHRQDNVRRNSVDFDHMLLAVTILDRMAMLQLEGGFTTVQLKESIELVKNEELKQVLKEMIKLKLEYDTLPLLEIGY